MKNRISALIVDDEPLGREGVRELLEGYRDITVVGECTDGFQAIAQISAKNPDLLFLDIQMPELDGFGVLQRIDPDKMPVVIFVTAFDEFALKAFEINALDYLLKPIDPERFAITLDRARNQLESMQREIFNQKLYSLMEGHKEGSPYLHRIALKTAGRIIFLKTEEIDWIEAEGDYVSLHVHEKKHLMRGKISELERKLDPRQFTRIHRSTIVNVDRIRELQPMFYGEYSVNLENGTKLTLSRTYRNNLLSMLENRPT